MTKMQKHAILLLGLVLFTHGLAISASELDDACAFAYEKLKSVTSGQINRMVGKFIYHEQHYQGCIIKLAGDRTKISDTQYPSVLFYPLEDSPLYKEGWHADEEADGPDGTSFRIIKGNVFCIVEGNWDGGDDSNPDYVPSTRFEVIVQCSKMKT